MGEVIDLDVRTRLDIPVERVLDGAKGLERVLVIGETEDGKLYVSSSTSNSDWALRSVMLFQHKLLAGDYDA